MRVLNKQAQINARFSKMNAKSSVLLLPATEWLVLTLLTMKRGKKSEM